MVLFQQKILHWKHRWAKKIHLKSEKNKIKEPKDRDKIAESELFFSFVVRGVYLTVPCERSFTSYMESLTCVCWLMWESWKKATLLRNMGLLVPCKTKVKPFVSISHPHCSINDRKILHITSGQHETLGLDQKIDFMIDCVLHLNNLDNVSSTAHGKKNHVLPEFVTQNEH